MPRVRLCGRERDPPARKAQAGEGWTHLRGKRGWRHAVVQVLDRDERATERSEFVPCSGVAGRERAVSEAFALARASVRDVDRDVGGAALTGDELHAGGVDARVGVEAVPATAERDRRLAGCRIGACVRVPARCVQRTRRREVAADRAVGQPLARALNRRMVMRRRSRTCAVVVAQRD